MQSMIDGNTYVTPQDYAEHLLAHENVLPTEMLEKLLRRADDGVD